MYVWKRERKSLELVLYCLDDASNVSSLSRCYVLCQVGHLFQNSRPLFIGLSVQNFNMLCEMDSNSWEFYCNSWELHSFFIEVSLRSWKIIYNVYV